MNLNYYFFVAPKIYKREESYIFITGSDSSHFKSAINCITSIQEKSSPDKLVFWDLGCSSKEIRLIKALGVTYRKFPYQEYPDFYNIKIDAGKYAWKSAVIRKTIEEFNLPVIWFDAGNILSSPYKIVKTTILNGFYSPYSAGRVKEWTYRSVIDYFGIEGIEKKRNLNGACVCFNPSDVTALKILYDWDEMSRKIELISPAGSSRLNHRQDQSLLTLLAYKYNYVKGMPHGYLDFTIHNDID